ncbi:MAG: hypothetical protein OSB67_01325 [Alphaproteobacteria bacterium]|jgi:hypothetical protein|nr:hypothetical protein [Alphaproteobacteria bacterium]
MTFLEATQGLVGAWRLLHFDRTGLLYFKITTKAFWNSFWAAAVVLPADTIATLLLTTEEAGTSVTILNAAHASLIYLEIYAIQWLLFPLVIATFAESILRSERFVLFVVASNWSNIMSAAIILPAVAIFAKQGEDAAGWGTAIYMVATGVTLVYSWFVARAALDAPPVAAVVVVLIQIFLAIVLWMTARALIG